MESDCADVAGDRKCILKKKLRKSVIRHKNDLEVLGPDFIIDTLKTFRDFLAEETEASLFISFSSPEEKRFILNIVNFSRSENIRSIFCKESRKILEEIDVLVSSETNFKLRNSTKPNSKFSRKDIRFTKVPMYEFPSEENGRPWYPRVETPLSYRSNRINFSKRSALLQIDHASRSAKNDPWEYFDRFVPPNVSVESNGSIGVTINNESNTVLNFESGPDSSLKHKINNKIRQPRESQKPVIQSKPGAMPSRKRVNEGRTGQLIEALSVPVKSDKAMKMMLGMGWRGGPLGAREDGIAEPIMPNLNSGSGAGLGHTKVRKVVKPPTLSKAMSTALTSLSSIVLSKPNSAMSSALSSTNSATSTATSIASLTALSEVSLTELSTSCISKRARNMDVFKLFVFRHLLKLLTKTDGSGLVKLAFRPTINKKEKKFIRSSVTRFNDGSSMEINNNNDIQELIEKISIIFRNDPDLMILSTVSKSEPNQLILEKTVKLAPIVPTGSTENGVLSQCTLAPKSRESESLRFQKIASLENYELRTFIDAYGQPFSVNDQKSADSLFKVRYLLQILKFVKGPSLNSLVIELERDASAKERFFVYDALARISMRRNFTLRRPEDALLGAIKTCIGAYNLFALFSEDKRSFTVTKDYEDYENYGPYTALRKKESATAKKKSNIENITIKTNNNVETVNVNLTISLKHDSTVNDTEIITADITNENYDDLNESNHSLNIDNECDHSDEDVDTGDSNFNIGEQTQDSTADKSEDDVGTTNNVD